MVSPMRRSWWRCDILLEKDVSKQISMRYIMYAHVWSCAAYCRRDALPGASIADREAMVMVKLALIFGPGLRCKE
jgi:hypothetical protein